MTLALDVLGPGGLIDTGPLDAPATVAAEPAEVRHAARSYFNYRKTMIYSGSNEIQRNIIAKAVLGL